MRELLTAALTCLCAVAASGDPALAVVELDSGAPGPVVAVVAGMHGDEPSGPAAARALAAAGPPLRGRLLVLAEANPAAMAARARTAPGGRDLNRLFPGAAGAGALAGEEARAAWILAALEGAGLVLDLHEEGGAWAEADLPTLVISPAAAGLALEMVDASRAGRFPLAFTGGPPKGSLVWALGERGAAAMAVEAPARLAEADRIALHLAVVEAALRLMGMR